MSFTTDICDELLYLTLKKNCCRRALLYGILCASRENQEGDTSSWILYMHHEGVAAMTEELLQKCLRITPQVRHTVRAGRATAEIRFSSPAVTEFLSSLESAGEQPVHLVVGFRCAQCRVSFLRGLFLGAATVSDPKKGYHMEWLFPTDARAAFVARALTDLVSRPGRIRRGNRYGCVYKSNGAISDILCMLGCAKTGFEVANASIERDIRNYENRATNCVASNISRSVSASAKQRVAIERLFETRKIDGLPEELRETAQLRLENPDASLSELALMHRPPISKSGLNRRLSKLMETAEEIENKSATE